MQNYLYPGIMDKAYLVGRDELYLSFVWTLLKFHSSISSTRGVDSDENNTIESVSDGAKY